MGRRDRNGQRLTFGHIQFTMPGSPSRPNLKIEKLGDREVSLKIQLIFLSQRYCYCHFSNECTLKEKKKTSVLTLIECFDVNRMF